MITFPNAKINLGLNIVAKRIDGYHDLETVFYPVPLKDSLEIVEHPGAGEKVAICISGIRIEGKPDDNLIVKAYHLLDKEYALPPVEVYLYKNIPTGAGLGGGSSDAAFMLKLLNEKFNLQISDCELEEYASLLGADCPFFIKNKVAFAEGIGNVFTPIQLSLQGYNLVICKPDIFVSTRDAFADIVPRIPEISLKETIAYPVEEWKYTIVNDFEKSVFSKFPAIGNIKEELYKQGAVYASMSGSGSSVFGLFNSEVDIKGVNFAAKSKVYGFAL